MSSLEKFFLFINIYYYDNPLKTIELKKNKAKTEKREITK